VRAATDLTGLVAALPATTVARRPGHPPPLGAEPDPDLADVRGQPTARLALELAAAGGHHLLMVGPPGAGKTMLARRLPGLLPDLDPADALEATMVHSAAGVPLAVGWCAARRSGRRTTGRPRCRSPAGARP
jgi:magnesium chelatase family protein